MERRAAASGAGVYLHNLQISQHDVFLSHSGVQKGFVKGLYDRLCPLYSTFFDVTHHSLPSGHSFPPRLFHAANTCKLAVLVLSHDFLMSRWSMLELHAVVNAKPQPIILPILFGLSFLDLKREANLEMWCMQWATFAAQDPNRIDATAWAAAFRTVSSKNGMAFEELEGQHRFIERVRSCICEILPPSLRHDFSDVQGKDRLTKILFDEFEGLQLHTESTTSQPGVFVLGMYGLPGSGKSTMSRCLCDHYFPHFSGKSLCIELPANPTDTQLLSKSKELFELTDFMDRVKLDGASHIRQVYQLLRTTNLQTSKVFLVLDNVTSSWKITQFVEALLGFGFGKGSKVLLVARTSVVLRPLLQRCQDHHHYICGSTSVPSLNSEEALQVLLQSTFGMGLDKPYLHEDRSLTPEQQKEMKEVVRMSGFDGGLLCLPLVLQIMGNKLRWHNLHVKSWKADIQEISRQAKLHKTDALKELLMESFRNLSEHLQILFLDVALFILPSSLNGIWYSVREACAVLCLMHDCSAGEILQWLQELQREGFLTILNDRRKSDDWTIVPKMYIHDVYQEFAVSVPQYSSNYYWGSSRKGRAGTRGARDLFSTNYIGLRTVILEQDEGLGRVDFPPWLSSVKAMVLRNCGSLAALFGLEQLTSLVSLEVHSCPRLKHVECTASDILQNLKRVSWTNMMNNEVQKQERSRMIDQVNIEMLMSRTWSWMVGGCRWPPAPERSMISVGCLASRLRGLQFVRLENTGIVQLPDLSQCWPLLRVLELKESRLEHLQVCDLPELERFVLFGHGMVANPKRYYERLRIEGDGSEEFFCTDQPQPREDVVRGSDFLLGCPKLKEVRVHSASMEGDWQVGRTFESPELRSLWLNNFWNAPELPHLGAAARSLEELVAQDCKELCRLNFRPHECVFENLTKLFLRGCSSLTEVSGLEGLPSLRQLTIEKCTKLGSLSGLSGLVSLEVFKVGRGCLSLAQALENDLENLTKLTSIDYLKSCRHPSYPVIFNTGSLVHLERLHLQSTINIFNTRMLTGVEYMSSLECLRLICINKGVSARINHSSVVEELGGLLGVPARPLYSRLSGLRSLTYLNLVGLENLTSLHGIEFLQSLTNLFLMLLENLTCAQGIQSLVNLQYLKLWWCASLEELPSLSSLVNLRAIECRDCVKLKKVEGCGGLTELMDASFTGCNFSALDCKMVRLLQFRLPSRNSANSLRLEGSKFATTDALLTWIEDEQVLPHLRRQASLEV